MSQRSLIEINHDYPLGKTDVELLAWAKKMQNYVRSGHKDELPDGVTLFWRRHHSDPCPFENPLQFDRRYGRLADPTRFAKVTGKGD